MWKIKKFEFLNVKEIHDMYQLRSEVFVVEQQCAFQDIDGHDFDAMHLLYYGEGGSNLIAYARIFFLSSTRAGASFGRVIVRSDYRRQGLAKLLVSEIIQWIEENSASSSLKIEISAQYHLRDFYANFGFKVISEPYDDCGVLHIDMVRQ